ncbi:2-hydroxyacid dehydrogenase [Burkholderia singularis]|uniref:D-3-phosphoglycerate dehydrogenase n=1 Tax=Burkholderia singularis TaxID=1503053 RepID=A0A238H706_9BURK|nr:glyoxylate/hydroxypyruvate reductase A [Burkholderia singularis]SMG01034.1 D-3-phosphoglycerate dehydrogenase [Burkholderia singularis]
MRILLHTPNDDAGDWQRDIERTLPGAQPRAWQPGDDAPADYALVWRAPRAFFAPRAGLKAIFNLGAGVDAMLALERDHPGTLPSGVPLVRLEDAGMAQQMIDYVAHAALRYLRRFDEYALLQRERRWQVLEPHPRDTFVVGVLGLGALGRQVAHALAALGLPVRGYSRTAKTLGGIATFAGRTQFDAFADGVKLLVNLLPSTADTAGLLNAQTFSKLARGAYLINAARGAHLVEADLLDALASGRVAAATLDVFADEPLPQHHPFWREPRITITPHCAAQTLRADAVRQIAEKIAALERGEPISGVVDRARGY